MIYLFTFWLPCALGCFPGQARKSCQLVTENVCVTLRFAMKVYYTCECHPSPVFQGGKAGELLNHPAGLHDEAVCVPW